MKTNSFFALQGMNAILVFCIWTAWIASSDAAVWAVYVDNNVVQTGSGTMTSPFKALSNINWTVIAQHVTAGDSVSINLKRGSEWREQLAVGASGVEGKPIVIQAYGEGKNPSINGSIALRVPDYRWTRTAVTNIWRLEAATNGIPYLVEPGGIWIDGQYQFNGYYTGTAWTNYAVAHLTTNRWSWNDADQLGYKTVYIFNQHDPNTEVLVEASQQPTCLLIQNRRHVTVTDVELKQSGLRVIVNPICYLYQSHNCTFERVFIHEGSSSAGAVYVMRGSNIVFRSCEVGKVYDPDGNGYGSLIYYESSKAGQCHNLALISNTIYGCYARLGDLVGVVGAWSSNKAYGVTGAVIEGNEFMGPAQNAVYFRSGCYSNRIARNYIHDIKGYGVGGGIAVQLRDHASTNWVINNIVINVYGPAMQSDGKNGGPGSADPSCHGNRFLHNTIYNGQYTGANGFHFFGTNTGLQVWNNILVSNSGDMILVGSSLVDGTYNGISLRNNCYFKTTVTGQEFVYRGVNYETIDAYRAGMQQSGYSNEAGSLYGDPGFLQNIPLIVQHCALAAGSRCINAGISLIDIETSKDFLGNSRLSDGVPDIGALEYHAAEPKPVPNPPTGLKKNIRK